MIRIKMDLKFLASRIRIRNVGLRIRRSGSEKNIYRTTSVADPDLGSGAFLTPGFWMGKNQNPG
jgi:hypothetical protein